MPASRHSWLAVPAAAGLGFVALALGAAVHLPRLVLGRGRPVDYLGALLAPMGVLLVAFAVRRALRGRGWRARVGVVAVGLVALQFGVLPVVMAALAINAPERRAPRAGTLGLPGARDVSFRARDGVRLDGWYVPGRGRTAVIVAHGSHGSRANTTDYVRFLARAGYGVLAFDARGHGSSAGETNALGWRGADDIAGAVAFLHRQPGVDPRRVALLGVSMGAEEGLRAAADGAALSAVVADGAGASTVGDQRLTAPGTVATAVAWLSMRATEALSGTSEPPPLKSIVGRIRVPVLLVASGARDEARIDRAYARLIGPGATLWSVPDAAHTGALQRDPLGYAARVGRFLGAP